ncbi:hypothetical protein VTN02DRAFT_2131 [Thermoascus thermophilus]
MIKTVYYLLLLCLFGLLSSARSVNMPALEIVIKNTDPNNFDHDGTASKKAIAEIGGTDIAEYVPVHTSPPTWVFVAKFENKTAEDVQSELHLPFPSVVEVSQLNG